jgi:hypothetical protein
MELIGPAMIDPFSCWKLKPTSETSGSLRRNSGWRCRGSKYSYVPISNDRRLAERPQSLDASAKYAIDVVDGGQHYLVVATVPGDLDDLEV